MVYLEMRNSRLSETVGKKEQNVGNQHFLHLPFNLDLTGISSFRKGFNCFPNDKF